MQRVQSLAGQRELTRRRMQALGQIVQPASEPVQPMTLPEDPADPVAEVPEGIQPETVTAVSRRMRARCSHRWTVSAPFLVPGGDHLPSRSKVAPIGVSSIR